MRDKERGSDDRGRHCPVFFFRVASPYGIIRIADMNPHVSEDPTDAGTCFLAFSWYVEMGKTHHPLTP